MELTGLQTWLISLSIPQATMVGYGGGTLTRLLWPLLVRDFKLWRIHQPIPTFDWKVLLPSLYSNMVGAPIIFAGLPAFLEGWHINSDNAPWHIICLWLGIFAGYVGKDAIAELLKKPTTSEPATVVTVTTVTPNPPEVPETTGTVVSEAIISEGDK